MLPVFSNLIYGVEGFVTELQPLQSMLSEIPGDKDISNPCRLHTHFILFHVLAYVMLSERSLGPYGQRPFFVL